jgi:hypothetical protein
LARLEGVIVIGLCALFAVKARQLRVLAALGVGAVVWVALSTVFVQDPLFPVHTAYTATLSSQYERMPLTYIFGAVYLAFGPVVAGLALASPFGRRFGDPLIPLTAAALVAFYGGVWAIGAFQSLPNPVYLVSAGVPVALSAHAALAGVWARRSQWPGRRWLIVPGVFLALELAINDQRRMLLVTLAVVAVQQLDERVKWALPLRRTAVWGAITLSVLFGLAMTHALTTEGTPKLVAQVREHLGGRLDDVLASNDPTFQWEVDPKPLEAARQHATGTLLIWNPNLARASHAPSDDELVRLGFRQIWVASDAGDTLAVWERYEIRRLPGEP